VVSITTAISTRQRTFSRPGMAVSQEESPSKKPIRLLVGEDVNFKGGFLLGLDFQTS